MEALQQEYVSGNVIKLHEYIKPDRTYYKHKPSGKSSEVYAFKSKEEIAAIITILDKHIAEAKTPTNKKIWHRNKLLFIIGINIALRGSDISQLRWCDIVNLDGTLKDNTKIQPQKTKKTGKFVFIHYNDIVKNVVSQYIELYPIEDLNDYIFSSKKNDKAIDTHQIWKIIKSIAAEAGISQNIGSHSLRKTFGYWVWHDSENKDEALVLLQKIFNHSSTQVTMHYIGIEQDDLSKVYDKLNYGIECEF